GAVGFKKAVALKRILPQYAKESQFVQMLAREAAIAAMLHHPNCVQVTELEDDGGELFMAMELLFGVTMDELAELLKKKGMTLPLGVAVRIATDAARALHYVHGLRDESGSPLGVVHRDVSPQNLFVTDDGITKMLDFGIATAVEVLDGDTRTGALKGKYLYMAPEQVNFQPVDARTDVWGLAVTLWGMLVGRPLFRDAGLLETLESIRSGAIRPPSAFRTDVPRALDEVVLGALQRAPERRTGSAGAFASALESVAANLPASSSQDVAGLVKSLGSERIQQLRARAASAVRVSEQIADASGAHRMPDSKRVMVAVRRPDTLPDPNDAGFVATVHAQGAASSLGHGPPGGPPITAVERRAPAALGPPTLRDGAPMAEAPRVAIRAAGAGAAAARDGETLTTPSTPIALGALGFAPVEAAMARPSSPEVETTDPVVRPSVEPAVPAPPSATVVPAVAAVVSRTPTPSARVATPVSAPSGRPPPGAMGGAPGLTATVGSRGGVARARHPWWLDAIAIAIGVGAAWAVAEVIVRR
ncbi:MAG: protein kinase, partial [Deltaproteobacteria bacterium]|nr:protein kinase [Deltaproteobacteria bacterium]